MQTGEILTIDSPEAITNSYSGELYSMKSSNMYRLMQVMREFKFTDRYFSFGEAAHVSFKNSFSNETEIKEYAFSHGLTDVEIQRVKPTIEDVFISYLG